MNSDNGDAAEYLAKGTDMNFPFIRSLTAKGIRITVTCIKSKHTCGYDEMTTWNTKKKKLHRLHSCPIRFLISQY